MDDTTTSKTADRGKRKRQGSLKDKHSSVVPSGREKTAQSTSAADDAFSQGTGGQPQPPPQPEGSPLSATALLQALLNKHQPAVQTSTGNRPSLAPPSTMSSENLLDNMHPDQVQGLLNLLNSQAGGGSASASHHEPTASRKKCAPDQTQPTKNPETNTPVTAPAATTSTTPGNNNGDSRAVVPPPLNYEIAALLASLHNPSRRGRTGGNGAGGNGAGGNGASGGPENNDLAFSLQQAQLQGLLLQHQLAAVANNPILSPHGSSHNESPPRTSTQEELVQKFLQNLNDNNNNNNAQLLHQQLGATIPFHLLASQHQQTSLSQTSSSTSNINAFLLQQLMTGAGHHPTMVDHPNSSGSGSNDNPFLWQNGANNNSNNNNMSVYPSTVQQETTNTLNHDVFRLMLLTSSSSSPASSFMGSLLPHHLMPPPSTTAQQPFPTSTNSGIPPPGHSNNSNNSNNNAALNSLILQSLGLAPPPPPPPPPQMDPNMLNMLLGHIAMNNPSMLAAMSTAPGAASSSLGPSDPAPYTLKNLWRNHDNGGPITSGGTGGHHDHDKEACCDDSSSADTCELANIDPVPMTTDLDDVHVSKYQCLVRKQIQFFEATDADVRSTAQGRNKPIVLGQVGIQCRHCVKSSPKLRARGAVYFPSKWSGIYQAAQNMASAHFAFCFDTPDSVKAQLTKLKEGKSTAGGGKKFWGESAADLGVMEDRHGLRFRKA